MTELTTLLFDVDGTLADTERDGHRVAFNQAFDEVGLDWNWSVELYGALLAVTGGKERIRFFIERYAPEFPPRKDEDAFIAELHKRKTHFYTQALKQGAIPLRPGVKRLLDEARRNNMRLAVATTTTPENVTALLESTLGAESLTWFEVIAAGDIVAAKKPAPDIYQYAMQRMAVPPQACIAFEDSGHGVKSALDAGIDRIIVTVNDYTREQDFSAASVVLDSLGEPDAPIEILSGNSPVSGDYVDLAFLQRLHRG